jgi:hypothetical protein
MSESEAIQRAFEFCDAAAENPSMRSIRRAMRSVLIALAMASADSAELPELLVRHSILAQARYELFGKRARDLTVAIRSADAAVQKTSADHPRRPAYRAVLGVSLWLQHLRTGQRSDLDEALTHLRQAVEATAPEHPQWRIFAGDLATVLSGHFQATGELSSRDEAIQITRHLAGTNDDGAVVASANLAVMLRRRHESHGRQADLDESVTLLREASASTELDDRHRGALMANTALAINRQGNPGEAVRLAERALAAARHDREIRPLALTNLAAALHDRFVAERSPTDLQRARRLAKESLWTTRRQDPARPRRAALLAQIYLTWISATGRTRFLDVPVRLLRYAARRTKDRPESAEYLVEAGRALNITALHHREKGRRRLSENAARQSVDALRQATSVRGTPAQVHVMAARNWAVFARALDLPEADDAFREFVDGLSLLAWPGVERSSQEASLAEWSSEIHRAPSHFLDRGNPAEALRSLDQSRGLLWAKMLELRADLDHLATTHPELAARLTEIRTALDAPGPRVSPRRSRPTP